LALSAAWVVDQHRKDVAQQVALGDDGAGTALDPGREPALAMSGGAAVEIAIKSPMAARSDL
jgi:hypothetical protein